MSSISVLKLSKVNLRLGVWKRRAGVYRPPAGDTYKRAAVSNIRKMVTRHQFQSMDPYDFEKLVATVWKSRGYDTDVRNKSGDRGIDVEARLDEKNVVIQVKRYSDRNTIGSQKVREYATLYQQTDADEVVIVTSGYFTDPGRELAQDLDVTTINGDELAKLIDTIDMQEMGDIGTSTTNQDVPDEGLIHAIVMTIMFAFPIGIIANILSFGLRLVGLQGAEDFITGVAGLLLLSIFVGGYYGLDFSHFSPSYWRTDTKQTDDEPTKELVDSIFTTTYKRIKHLSIFHSIGFPLLTLVSVLIANASIEAGDLIFLEGFSQYPLTTILALIFLGYLMVFPILCPLAGYYISKDKKHLLREFDQDKLLDFWMESNNLSDETNNTFRPLLSNQITRHWLFLTLCILAWVGFYPLYYLYNRKRVNLRLASDPSAFDMQVNETELSAKRMEAIGEQLSSADEDTVAEIRTSLRSTDSNEREQGTEILAIAAQNHPISVKPFLDDLQPHVNDSNESIRENIAVVFASLAEESPQDARQVIAEFGQLLNDEEKIVRGTALAAVAGIAQEYPRDIQPVVEDLRQYLHDDDELMRQNAALVLERLAAEYPNEIVPFVEDLQLRLNDESHAVRRNTVSAISTLAQSNPEALLPLVNDLRDCLADKSWRVRANVPIILALIADDYQGEKKLIAEDIRPLLEDEKEEVRENAARALKAMVDVMER